MKITRRLEFDAAHRLLKHQGKCRHLHGHRYVVLLTVESLGLDDQGMVVDFSVVKDRVGKWIDDNLDHNTLCHPDDKHLMALAYATRTPFIMPTTNPNPTAENIAIVLYDVAKELLPELRIAEVRVFETPNCYATLTKE